MNDFDSSLIKDTGFSKGPIIGELMSNRISFNAIPKVKGVYLIVSEENSDKKFLRAGTGGFFKGKDPNVTLSELEHNWVEETSIFYIGKAGSNTGTATLNSRIKQLIKFGCGQNIGHWGGRLLWQLAFANELYIYYKTCSETEDPREIEKNLISQFTKHYRKRPYANLSD